MHSAQCTVHREGGYNHHRGISTLVLLISTVRKVIHVVVYVHVLATHMLWIYQPAEILLGFCTFIGIHMVYAYILYKIYIHRITNTNCELISIILEIETLKR